MTAKTKYRLTLKGFISSAPDFALAVTFLVTWVYPYAFGQRAVRYLMFVMLLEFIVMHSTGFLGSVGISNLPKKKKAMAFAGMLLFYSLFAGGFSAIYGSLWPLLSFWILTLAKFPSVVLESFTKKEKEALQKGWGTMVAVYVLGATITTFFPMPRLGITKEVIRAQVFKSSGLWIAQPWRVIAFGVLYFTILGMIELLRRCRIRPPKV